MPRKITAETIKAAQDACERTRARYEFCRERLWELLGFGTSEEIEKADRAFTRANRAWIRAVDRVQKLACELLRQDDGSE